VLRLAHLLVVVEAHRGEARTCLLLHLLRAPLRLLLEGTPARLELRAHLLDLVGVERIGHRGQRGLVEGVANVEPRGFEVAARRLELRLAAPLSLREAPLFAARQLRHVAIVGLCGPAPRPRAASDPRRGATPAPRAPCRAAARARRR